MRGSRSQYMLLAQALVVARDNARNAGERMGRSPVDVENLIGGVDIAACHIAIALRQEVGAAFDKERFLRDAGVETDGNR